MEGLLGAGLSDQGWLPVCPLPAAYTVHVMITRLQQLYTAALSILFDFVNLIPSIPQTLVAGRGAMVVGSGGGRGQWL